MHELLYIMIRRNWKTIKVHLGWWLIYILLEIFVTRGMNGRFSTWEYYLIFYILNIILFYFHAFVTMDTISFNKKEKSVKFIILLFTELAIYFGLSMLLSGIILYTAGSAFSLPELNLRFVSGTFWRSILCLGFSSGYFFHRQFMLKQKLESEHQIAMEKIKNQLLATEQEFLRAQINPHLLFNTLNFIKYASKKDPKLAEEAIFRFSEIMTYALSGEQKRLSSLNKEVAQIRNIIGLNRLRFGKNLVLEYCEDIGFDHEMPPIILLTLVENIFKHGDFQSAAFPVKINVQADARHIYFTTENLIKKNPNRSSSNTGLRNIKSRLSQSHSNNSYFEATKDGNIFRTKLEITFD